MSEATRLRGLQEARALSAYLGKYAKAQLVAVMTRPRTSAPIRSAFGCVADLATRTGLAGIGADDPERTSRLSARVKPRRRSVAL